MLWVVLPGSHIHSWRCYSRRTRFYCCFPPGLATHSMDRNPSLRAFQGRREQPLPTLSRFHATSSDKRLSFRTVKNGTITRTRWNAYRSGAYRGTHSHLDMIHHVGLIYSIHLNRETDIEWLLISMDELEALGLTLTPIGPPALDSGTLLSVGSAITTSRQVRRHHLRSTTPMNLTATKPITIRLGQQLA